jgi:hypothetical protein
MMACQNCDAPNRLLWPPSVAHPKLSQLEKLDDFSGLKKCADCERLWLSVKYEPYAAFEYLALWPHTQSNFDSLREKSRKDLLNWMRAFISLNWKSLDQKEQELILAHDRRAYGQGPIHYVGSIPRLDFE